MEKVRTIINAGFNPIAYCNMYGEDVFIFETIGEAMAAHNQLEGSGQVQGFWYSREEFINEKTAYEEIFQMKVKIQEL